VAVLRKLVGRCPYVGSQTVTVGRRLLQALRVRHHILDAGEADLIATSLKRILRLLQTTGLDASLVSQSDEADRELHETSRIRLIRAGHVPRHL
jgi:hypothetical protein